MPKVPRALKLGVAVTVAVFAVPVLGSHAAMAQSGTGYHIEYSQLYCAHGGTSCANEGSSQDDVRYAEVSAFSLAGSSGSQPTGVVFVCGYNYTDPQGHLHEIGLHAFVGPQEFGYDGGTPSGYANFQSNANEDSTATQSSVAVGGYDSYYGVYAEATGYGTTNNVTDLLTYGSATITMSGWFDDFNTYTETDTLHAKFGTLTCNVSVRPNLREDSESLAQPFDDD